MADSKVFKISRLVQWRIDSLGLSCRKTKLFNVGLWNWHLSVERNRCLNIRLFPEPSKVCQEQPPIASFILRVSTYGSNRTPHVSSVREKFCRTGEEFFWPLDIDFQGHLIIDVKFLDLTIVSLNGGESKSIWLSDGIEYISTQTTLKRLSRMFSEAIHADVTIITADGSLSAHKAILSASSPIFRSMFHHEMKEKESSTIEIQDLSVEICTILLSYLYGTIKQEDFWKFRISLLEVANKYIIPDLKHACEESLMEDIDSGNVLERLQMASLYQLDKLKKECMAYLFDFAKVYEIKDEIKSFCRSANRELASEIFEKLLSAWRP